MARIGKLAIIEKWLDKATQVWHMRVGKFPVGPGVAAILALAIVLFISMDGCGLKKRSRAPLPAFDTIADTTNPAAFATAPDPVSQSLIDEANARFTYKDQAIHPFAVRNLMEWAGEEYPSPIALDLEGSMGTQRYVGDWSIDNGVVKALNPPPMTDELDEEINYGYFTYQRLGTLANGWHVVRTGDNGGGESTFEALLFVRFGVDEEHGELTRRRVVMERRGIIPLGDRYQGRIRVFGDSISISADIASGYRTEDKSYGFQGLE